MLIDQDPNPLNDELVLALQAARSKPLRSLQQWIEDEVYLADGPSEGFRYSFDRQPVQKLIVMEIDSGNWQEIYILGPSQSGKTLIAFVYPLLYHLTEMGESLVMGVPEARMADDKFKVDILPPMKASPRLASLIPEKGPGSKGGVVRDTVTLQNAAKMKIMTRSGSDQSKAGFTSRVVVVTEAAGFSRVSETSREANPLRQLQARQRAYDAEDRRLYVEGTVTIEEDLPWSARSDSSNSRIVSECPWCAEWILPEREHLVGFQEAESSGEAGRLAYWVCPECGGEINDDQRRDMVAKARLLHEGQSIDSSGNVVGERPDTSRLWVRYTAWHNMFVSTATLGQEEWRASRVDPEDPAFEDVEKERCQFVWAKPYKPQVLEREPLRIQQITRKRDDFPRGVCPTDTTHLACGVDMGLHSAWFVVLAGRACGKTHYVNYGPIDVPSRDLPVEQAVAIALEELRDSLELGYRWTGGKNSLRVPDQVWIDSNYLTDEIFAFCRKHGARSRSGRYVPILGRGSGQMQAIYQAPTKRGGGIVEIGTRWHMSLHKAQRCFQIFTDSDHWKDQVHHAFFLDDDKPGCSTLFSAPQAEHKLFGRHITNEQRNVEFVPGRGEVLKWDRRGAQHLLDAAQYARAALDRCGFRSGIAEPKN